MNWNKETEKITKEFTFKNFKEALAFVNQVGDLAENMDHHPDILLHSYKKVTISLTSHSDGKVTEKDHQLASKIDEI
ncbi:4a-hydroxytetrahydrobiopterin dehydratase [Sunxiuqinia dokdonensis]|uniref:4a-hydroxytetrahydrobiopterin dehydratase n=1 Tax=Sunxiuqinia dokdonensis TaxID=1409788 RepID=A0A0L8VB14_9BACT|nr:4a-hydroxytetrahydrobiopterin dehydratase [Sunxiuqinia dokdonensis]KOH45650.1 pterin-4-alpha-carbinolamine dehydratase [Sunxiuqinia dokdonensis]